MSKVAAPEPPAGLTAVGRNDWAAVWKRVRVQPKVDVKPWNGGSPIQITPSVKAVGIWAAEFANYDDGASIFPGTEKLADVAGFSPKTTGLALAAICQLGFLWQYLNGSRVGRPKDGQHGVASEYRLTVPDDALARVPMLTPDLNVPIDHPNSDHLISDQLISDRVSPELSDSFTRTQFTPPCSTLHTPSTSPGVSVINGSVEGTCPRCGQKIKLTPDGALPPHGGRHSRCQGSGLAPLTAVAESLP